MENLRVVKVKDKDLYYIVKEEQIKTDRLCECYKQGEKWGCDDAGCWTLEIARKIGDEWDGAPEHTTAQYIEYRDEQGRRCTFLLHTDLHLPSFFDGELLKKDDEIAGDILAVYKSSRAKMVHWEFIRAHSQPSFVAAQVRPAQKR